MNIKFCDITEKPIKSCILHSHKHWEIILHLRGHTTSIIGGKEYRISKNDISIIPPEVVHGGHSDMAYTDMYIQCEDLDFNDIRILHDFDNAVYPLMKLLHKVYTEKGNSYKIIADNILTTIVSYLHKYADAEPKYSFVNDLKNQIYEHFSDCEFNILEYARTTGYNIDYLRRCFKKETGKTPLAYLTDMRLNHAKGLLKQETFLSVVDVAEKCGFNDSFYFSKIFKQHFNVSPLNYRMQQKR